MIIIDVVYNMSAKVLNFYEIRNCLVKKIIIFTLFY